MPSPIRLIESASASDRIEAARAFIERYPADREILIIGASRAAADDLARLIAIRREATFGLHRYSLIQLAAALALTRPGHTTAPTTSLGNKAIAARVSYEALQQNKLNYYTPVIQFPGFPGALARTLGELRLAGIKPTAIGPVARGDAAEFLRRFEEQLTDGRFHDLAAMFHMAAEAAAGDPPNKLLQNPLVLLDTPIDSPAHQAFVASLIECSPSTLVTLPSGDEKSRRVFSSLSIGLKKKDSVAAHAASDSSQDELDRLRAYVFSPESPPQDGRRGEVLLFSAPGEGRECVEIARLALEEASKGVPFDHMAVLLRNPAMYTSLLETALARAGMPAYFAQGTSRPDPTGRAFLTLIDCALEGFSAKRFAEYLAFGQVPDLGISALSASNTEWIPPEDESLGPAARRDSLAKDDDDTEAVSNLDAPRESFSQTASVIQGGLRAPRKWEDLLVESAVIGGLDRWRRRLDGLAEEYRLKWQELTRDPAGASRVLAVEQDLQNLEHLRTFALPVIEGLSALPEQATWGKWIPALEALAPLVLRKPQRVLTVLAELRPLAPVGPVRLAEVRAVLAPQLANLEQPRPPYRYGRLFVGTIDEARGRTFDIIFVPGLAERIFPQKPREDPILLDEARETLALQLRTQRDRSDHERFLLRLAIGAATRRLYLSYPRLDVDAGRSRVASFYALEVHRALTGTIPDPETVERTAADIGRTRLAWPAPEVPTYAIDDIEHDLATLRVLLSGPLDAARGRARYLLNLNDCLARSLRSRWQRWHTRWTAADGLVRVTERTRAPLEAARLTARAYSVGTLEHFADCPYRFALLGIHRLAPRQDAAPLEYLDPLTRGAIAHDVQAEFMRHLQAAGQLPLVPERAAAAMRMLDETLGRVANEHEERLAPAIPRIWRAGIESLRVDLRMWLERSITAHATWDPVAFELAFGLPIDQVEGVDPQSVEHEVVVDGGYRLRGIVDLIERRRGAEDLRVTDHKTGAVRVPRGVVVGGGGTLQPVLYALAVQNVLGAPVVEARLFYCTRDGQFEERVVRITGTDAADRAHNVLDTIDRAIVSGFLPPAPRPKACGRCDFRDVCGPHEEVRVMRKERAPLTDLQTMRNWR